ncbi:MAG: hypothetical protein ACJ8D6_06740 [Sphingomicrobium sp.]
MIKLLARYGAYLLVPCIATAAAAEVWQTLARDDGDKVLCKSVRTDEELQQVLTRAGWSKIGHRRPEIDFGSEYAVVIAPGVYRENSDIKYVNSTTSSGTRTVHWQFKNRPPQGVLTEGVADFSSQGPAAPEILVVTFPRSTQGFSHECDGPYGD